MKILTLLTAFLESKLLNRKTKSGRPAIWAPILYFTLSFLLERALTKRNQTADNDPENGEYLPGEVVVETADGQTLRTGQNVRDDSGETGTEKSAAARPPAADSGEYIRRRLLPLLKIMLGLQAFGMVGKCLQARGELDNSFTALLGMLTLGAFETVVVFFCLIMPLAVWWAILPRTWHGRWFDRWLSKGGLYLLLFILVFSKLAEQFFWQDFGVSFNFIAVDYLIYTHELVGNLWQTYPLGKLLCAVAVLAWYLYRWLQKAALPPDDRGLFSRVKDWFLGRGAPRRWGVPAFGGRVVLPLGAAVMAAAGIFLHDYFPPSAISANRYVQEAAKNDIYSFGAAFFRNEIKYDDFYLTASDVANRERLRAIYSRPDTKFLSYRDLRRVVNTGRPQKDLNVVFVVMESQGYEFMNETGLYDDLTPQLTALAEKSLYFPCAYATGTRTVRGLEAIALGLPPQAGMSIIRQQGNGDLFGLGEIFRARGYDPVFIYGGYGYFDNMNDFFRANGFRVIDRTAIDDAVKIHHETIWGVADEDMYTQAIREADRQFAAGQKFCQLLMTTSNHSPYTYPADRVKLPSGESRRPGAVQYADWAVGDYIRRAQEKPWFNDTVFVIIGDHGAASAGKMELNPEKHRVVFMIYSPAHVPPRRVDGIAVSQIDAAPTLLGILGGEYATSGFGGDILAPGYQSRYFLADYQNIGYGIGENMVVLKPGRQTIYYRGGEKTDREPIPGLTADAVAYYQTAAQWRQFLKK